MLARTRASPRIGELALGEEALGEAGAALERPLDPLDLQKIQADCHRNEAIASERAPADGGRPGAQLTRR